MSDDEEVVRKKFRIGRKSCKKLLLDLHTKAPSLNASMPKANQKDKGSSSSIRSAKGGRGGKGGKAGRGQDPESIRYSTLDDALEAGVQAEENGERWSVGYKAQKSYESALKIYKQATGLDSTSADAFYNV